MKWIATVLAALFLASCQPPKSESASFIPHPDNPNSRIEYFVEKPAGQGPWPTVIFLHGYQDAGSNVGGAAFVRWGELSRNAKKGYLAVSVSLPGFGKSTGPADFAGPYTQHAVEAVMEQLQQEKWVKPKSFILHGVSLGAITAALIGTRRTDIGGLVLISGLYDLPTFFDSPPSLNAAGVKTVLIAQTGGSAEALQMRSAMPGALKISANTLIMNGAKDDKTSPGQARQLAEAINTSGGKAKVHIFEEYGHEIPFKVRVKEVDQFMESAFSTH